MHGISNGYTDALSHAPLRAGRSGRLLFLALVLGCLAIAFSGHAQAPGPSGDPAAAANIDRAGVQLRAIASDLHTHTLSDADLNAKLAAIAPIQVDLTADIGRLTARLQDVDARFAQLGPAPSAGQPPESAEDVEARRSLALARQGIDGAVKQGRLLTVVATQTSREISDRLRANFQKRLWARSRSVLDPSLIDSLGAAVSLEATRVAVVVDDEGRLVAKAARTWRGGLAIVLGCLLAIVLAIPARLLLDRRSYRRADRIPEPTRLQRSSFALWRVLVATSTPLLAGWALRAALGGAGALTPDFDRLLNFIANAVAVTAFLEVLGRTLLSPDRPAWRLAPLPPDLIARLAPFPILIALSTGFALLVANIDATFGGPFATSVAGERLTVTLEVLSVGGALLTTARRRKDATLGPDTVDVPEVGARQPGESRVPWVIAALAAWLALGVAFGAILAGYLALAELVMRETIWVATVLGLLFLMLLFVDDVFTVLLSRRTRLGRLLHGPLGMTDPAAEHIAVLMSGAGRLIVLLVGWTLILLPAGSSPGHFFTRFTSAQTVFKIGQVSVSPAAILGSIALFAVGMTLTRAIRGWLDVRYLPKTRMDAGVRMSVSALFSYLGMALALTLAFAYLGLSFTQITLFASALSVGIGFGLQSIISNFVSGLILLVERPVKVGDWVAIGDQQGDVKAINIRATEINMMDRSLLIVPNSELVTKAVRNVTHAGALGRVMIVFHMDSAVRPSATRELVLARLKAHPAVLTDPGPAVYFADIKNGVLEFDALAFVASPRLAFGVKSELLFQIVEDMQDAGMAMLTTNTVVNVGVGEAAARPI